MPTNITVRRTTALFLMVLLGGSSLHAEEDLQAATERLRQLSDEERRALSEKVARFESLLDVERERIRKLEQELAALKESKQLVAVMESFTAWHKTLTPEERLQIAGAITDDARVAEIRKIKESHRLAAAKAEEKKQQALSSQDVQRIAAELSKREDFSSRKRSMLDRALQVPKEDRDRVYDWFVDTVKKNNAEFLAALPEESRKRLQGPGGDDAQRLKVTLLAALTKRVSFDSAFMDPESFHRLESSLSPEARHLLGDLPEHGARMHLVQVWASVSFWERHFAQVDAAKLDAFRDALPKPAQELLMKLPPLERDVQIKRMYARGQILGTKPIDMQDAGKFEPLPEGRSPDDDRPPPNGGPFAGDGPPRPKNFFRDFFGPPPGEGPGGPGGGRGGPGGGRGGPGGGPGGGGRGPGGPGDRFEEGSSFDDRPAEDRPPPKR